MKVLFTADIHDDRELIKKVIENSKKVDLVAVVGDVLSYYGLLSNKFFSKIEKPVIFIPGNHDSPEFLTFVEENYDNVYILHLNKKEFDKFIFAGIGFAESIGPWMEDSKSIKTFLDKLKKDLKDKGYYTILLFHEHPGNELGIPGSQTIKSFLENYKVKLAIHGHLHELGSLEKNIGKNRVINVARSIKIIDL